MKAGFARIDMTPPLGTNLAGYYNERPASGIITPLYINAVAFDDGETRAALITLDLEGMTRRNNTFLRERIAEKNGLDPEAIFIHCSHTHLGPVNGIYDDPEKCSYYDHMLIAKTCDAVTLAFKDLAASGEAKAFIGRSATEGLSFVRIYLMTDGKLCSNPPKNRFHEIVKNIGEPDEEVQLLRITREGAADIAIVNYQTHPDVIGGSKICYDWPGYVREYIEKGLCDVAEGKGLHAVCVNGAQGETNQRDLKKHDRINGIDYSKHMARVIVGKAMSVYSYADEIDFSKIKHKHSAVRAIVDKGTPEQVEMAKIVSKINAEGGYKVIMKALADGEVPFGPELAFKYLILEHEPEVKDLFVSALAVGDMTFVGFPGEPFTEMGRRTKEESPFAMTMPCCYGNGGEGYFPMNEIFDLGGYEAETCRYKRGTSEMLMEEAIKMVKELHN